MQIVTHQTVKLSHGKHGLPDEGVCVMELASILAGDWFSDHPRSVCPVIASLLRSYNDAVSWRRRQDLLPCAAAVVGTSGSRAVRRARVAHLLAWHSRRAEERAGAKRSRPRVAMLPMSLRCMLSRPVVGRLVVRSIDQHTDATHREILALIQELIEIGAPATAHADHVDVARPTCAASVAAGPRTARNA